MKKLLTIFCLALLVSCSNEVPSDKLVERNGITYETNSTTPFTGSSVSYHENGQLEMRGNYKDGKDDGLWESYYENGQLEMRGNYKDGEPDGLREFHYDNGQLESRGNVKDGRFGFGQEDGLWEYFDEEGNLTETQEWKDGELIE